MTVKSNARAAHARRLSVLKRAGESLYYAASIAVADLAATIDHIEPHMRRGMVLGVDIGHQPSCACRHGTAPLERCSCSRVELHVFEVRA